MEFGIFSNGIRPHTSAARTYEEDIHEIVLADKLGFRDAYISEHHGEPPLYQPHRHHPGAGADDVQGGRPHQPDPHGGGGQADPPAPPRRRRDPGGGDRPSDRRALHLRFRFRVSPAAVLGGARAELRRPPRAPQRSPRLHPEMLGERRAVRLGRRALEREGGSSRCPSPSRARRCRWRRRPIPNP